MASTPETKAEPRNWAVFCEGFGTLQWKSYFKGTLGLAWDEDSCRWWAGNLDEEGARFMVEEISQHCSKSGRTPFLVYCEQTEKFGESRQVVRVQHYGWRAVLNRAKELLKEGRDEGTISRKEELGYLGAIAVIEDKKSRPADKKAAVDLIMRLEGVFEDRNKGIEEGEEAKGTKELIEMMRDQEPDGSD